MAWFLLIVAGLLEVAWAIGLKASQGFTRFWPSVWTVVGLAGSMWLLGIAARTLPISTAYPVWVGIGACGSVLLGILYLGEPASPAKIGCVVLLIISIVGLKLTSH